MCCCQVILMSPCGAEEIVFYSAVHRAHQALTSIYEQQADKDMTERAVYVCICNIVHKSCSMRGRTGEERAEAGNAVTKHALQLERWHMCVYAMRHVMHERDVN